MFVIEVGEIFETAIDILKNCYQLHNADDEQEIEYYFNKIRESVVHLTDLCWKD